MTNNRDYSVLPGESESRVEEELKVRPRSPTLLNLKWIGERLKRARQVRQDLESGRYVVDSTKLARALLNRD